MAAAAEGRTITILKSIRSCHLAATQHNIPTENAPPRRYHNILCRRNAPAAASYKYMYIYIYWNRFIYIGIDIYDDIYSLYGCTGLSGYERDTAVPIVISHLCGNALLLQYYVHRLQVRSNR